MGPLQKAMLNVGKETAIAGKNLLWTNRSGWGKLGSIGGTAYLGSKLIPDSEEDLLKKINKYTNKERDIERDKIKTAQDAENIKYDRRLAEIDLKRKKEQDARNAAIAEKADKRIKGEQKTTTTVTPTTPVGSVTEPTEKSHFNPYVVGGVAAAGLGYLALKKLKSRRDAKKFAEQDFNRQYS